jgi:hypothetical protein
VNFEIFLDKAYGVGSFFWLPMLFWPAYFFWCHFFDYPAVLEKHIRNSKVWPYLPMFWKGKKRKLIRSASVFLFWGGNIFGGCALFYLFPYKHFAFLLIGMGLAAFIEIELRSFGTSKIVRLQQDRFFQIYTQLANQVLSKGNDISDSELLSKTQWQHQNDLRLVDRQGRLLEFLRGEAKL